MKDVQKIRAPVFCKVNLKIPRFPKDFLVAPQLDSEYGNMLLENCCTATVIVVSWIQGERSPDHGEGRDMNEVTRIIHAIEQGDEGATEKLLPLVYKELRALAAQKMAREKPGQTLQATALVHEAYLRLVGSEGRDWDNRGHFFKAAAELSNGSSSRICAGEPDFQPSPRGKPLFLIYPQFFCQGADSFFALNNRSTLVRNGTVKDAQKISAVFCEVN